MADDRYVQRARDEVARCKRELDSASRSFWSNSTDRADEEVRRWKYNLATAEKELAIAEQEYQRSKR